MSEVKIQLIFYLFDLMVLTDRFIWRFIHLVNRLRLWNRNALLDGYLSILSEPVIILGPFWIRFQSYVKSVFSRVHVVSSLLKLDSTTMLVQSSVYRSILYIPNLDLDMNLSVTDRLVSDSSSSVHNNFLTKLSRSSSSR